MKRNAILFTVFIILVVILADTGRFPHFVSALYDFPNGDRLGHFILFGILDFFITRAVLFTLPSRPPIWVALSTGLIIALFVAAEEYSQNFFSSRTADWVDLLASYSGMLIGGSAALKVNLKQR